MQSLILIALPVLAALPQDRVATLEDIYRVYQESFGPVHSIALTEVRQIGRQRGRSSVTLVGLPAWRYWKYEHTTVDEEGRTRGIFGSFDGKKYRLVQDDGLGMCVSEYSSPNAYMTAAGMTLSHVGLGPESQAAHCWKSKLLKVDDGQVEPGPQESQVVLRRDDWQYVLDSHFGFMPVEKTADSIRLTFSGYQQHGSLWLPSRIERTDPGQPFTIDIRDVVVNGSAEGDVVLHNPFGLSVRYDGDVTRIFGTGDLSEAEQGLNNWLLYFGWAGRTEFNVLPLASPPVLARFSAGLGVWTVVLAIASALLAVRLLLLVFSRHRWAAGVLALFGASSAPGGDGGAIRVDEPASCANATYLSLLLYGKQPELSALYGEFEAAGDGAFRLAAETLRREGVFVAECSAELEEILAWPHPVILEVQRVQPARTGGVTKAIVVVGQNEFGVTALDANPYGALHPWEKDALAKRWTGRAIVTAPQPIRIKDRAVGPFAWSLAAFVTLGLCSLFVSRAKLARLGATTACLVGLLCGCARESNAVPARGEARIEPSCWDLGATYGGVATREFKLINSGPDSVSIAKVEKSCGCLAQGLAEGTVVGAATTVPFTMGIDLGQAPGSVRHTLKVAYSNGAEQVLTITGQVRAGVVASPDRVDVSSDVPLQDLSADVFFESDDATSFAITNASIDLPGTAEVAAQDNAVRLRLKNDNRHALRQGALLVETTHPHRAKLRVPVFARFTTNWETKPASVFVHGGKAGEIIERKVQLIARQGTPFQAIASAQGETQVSVDSTTPAASQVVTIRLPAPVLNSGPRREAVLVRTTLPGAEEIEVPFLFYP